MIIGVIMGRSFQLLGKTSGSKALEENGIVRTVQTIDLEFSVLVRQLYPIS